MWSNEVEKSFYQGKCYFSIGLSLIAKLSQDQVLTPFNSSAA